ncbi:hypothetical protein [Bradyrhizobium cenepequi]|uniref:hypothetical protein n=1 Tax=Bradyrhizobium cenepequi TaxID=2821403 RepID=UPI001CE2A0FF|nr:hypothetical protein [Bradyrhizobium cenepequi]MCA6106115.1 hypothetical protein [Bradyrhizobium cenepequi]
MSDSERQPTASRTDDLHALIETLLTALEDIRDKRITVEEANAITKAADAQLRAIKREHRSTKRQR